MDRRVVRGNRRDLLIKLKELADGFAHFDNTDKMVEALEAYGLLLAGRDVVTAGHTEYRVEEEESHLGNG